MAKRLTFMTRRSAGGNPYIDLQLRSEELAAIGRVTTQFAFLEFLVLRESKGLAKYLKEPLPKDAEAISFRKRRTAWKGLARRALRELDEELQRTERALDKIVQVAEERHKLTHNVIKYETHDHSRLKAFPRATLDQFGWPLDTAKLRKLPCGSQRSTTRY